MASYNYYNDTIAAIATAIGEAGIGLVRISGPDALLIADKMFVSKDSHRPSTFRTYTTHYGWIVENSNINPSTTLRIDGERSRTIKIQIPKLKKPEEFIDEVILTVMRAPRSYTKEDIVEINCHGGIVALRRVLDLVLENGARLAEAGEFTKRAFLNGRIDLTQAEAVLDIIKAKTDSALKVAMAQLEGGLSKQINKIRKVALGALCVLEANIDFPEEEIGSVNLRGVSRDLEEVSGELKRLIQDAGRGRILREGIRVVICGRPNVGKSSLLNALLKQERSIVTSIPGTTRDTIEEIIDIKGAPIRIVDTAGIIESKDLVEKKAVRRSKKYIAQAELVILLFDGSSKLTQADEILMKKLKNKTTIAVINKIDLRQKIERDKIKRSFGRVIDISAKKLKNIVLLEDEIANLVYDGRVTGAEPVLLSNTRHTVAIKEAQKLVEEAQNSLDNKLSLEFIAQGLKDALLCLDSVLGTSFSEDLLEKIFSEFCIGK
jgi:tRNA modification GTPase